MIGRVTLGEKRELEVCPAALCDFSGQSTLGGPVDRGQGLPDHGTATLRRPAA
ncbi:MAG: hypothetical protein ACLT9P_08080 [Evtepia gabavorous]